MRVKYLILVTLATGLVGCGGTSSDKLETPSPGQINIQPQDNANSPSGYSGFVFFFISPGTEINNTSPSIAVAQGQSVPPLTLPAGIYEIVLECDSSTNVCPETVPAGRIFDSGPAGVALPSADGSDVITVEALDATSSQESSYGSPVTLLLQDSKGEMTALYNGQN